MRAQLDTFWKPISIALVSPSQPPANQTTPRQVRHLTARRPSTRSFPHHHRQPPRQLRPHRPNTHHSPPLLSIHSIPFPPSLSSSTTHPLFTFPRPPPSSRNLPQSHHGMHPAHLGTVPAIVCGADGADSGEGGGVAGGDGDGGCRGGVGCFVESGECGVLVSGGGRGCERWRAEAGWRRWG